ncbi:carbohydrate ABC transporter permease [Halomarina ordinaria]|uniref:Carbohydrate ABC transporter permease n=1 Tax=Halomarina ordinaria TaxID=3033939 RepID=A0ABD5U630_9EURY|nr:sugar ABC transporter permease [Halomarina sp. PSRA2]
MSTRLRKLVDRARRAVGRGGEEAVRPDGGTVAEGTRSRWARSDFVSSLPFWLPPALLVGLFVYGAIGWNFLLSLTDAQGFVDPDYGNLDFDMYARLLGDPTFWTAARNTLVLLVAFTGICLVGGLLLAILVDQQIRFEEGIRTIYLLPMSLSFVVTAKFWAWIYNAQSGVVNVTLERLGLGWLAQDWLGDPQFTLGAVIFALLWQYSGYAMVVYLAGLRAIPTEHFEAARVDGASTFRMYRRVVVPQLRASTVSAAVVLMVFALKAFDFLYTLFGKTPGPAADILATMMYRVAFDSSEWAYGSAVAVVLFLMALAVVGPYLYSEYRRGAL